MIASSDIFDAAKRNDEVYILQHLGTGLYLLLMEDDRNNGLQPQKMNSYGVLEVIDPTWYGMQFAPRNLTKEMEDSVEAADVQYDAADFEDFANNWEELESDDGHRELYDDLDIADTVLE
tara:strand:+ start:31 stop:390 length:360 start_codon:yes stop_codon:yes gene_type:complete